jgi:hypothetical protein
VNIQQAQQFARFLLGVLQDVSARDKGGRHHVERRIEG